MWPMVAGVGPVLGEGVLGFFIDPTGAASNWEYRDGASWLGGVVRQQLLAHTDCDAIGRVWRCSQTTGLRAPGSPRSLRLGAPDTRSFGMATCGLSTANRGFTMSDGATLILTVSVMADRTGAKYRGFDPAG